MMMISMIGANTPYVYNKAVKLASAATPAEGGNTTTQEAATPVVTTTVTPAVNSASVLGTTPITPTPINSIQTNTTNTVTGATGNTLVNSNTSELTTINRQQPTLDLKLHRTTINNRVTGQKTQTTEFGVKGSMSGEGGSASIDLSDKTTDISKIEIDDLPTNVALGRKLVNGCKLVKRGKDGAVTKYEAPKDIDGNCIEGSLILNNSNYVEDEDKKTGVKTATFTQPREKLPAGVTIEYTQIPDGK